MIIPGINKIVRNFHLSNCQMNWVLETWEEIQFLGEAEANDK